MQKTILLVEDEQLIALSEAQTLKDLGYNVIIENSGENAIKLFNNNNLINLILMDVNLGKGMDGITTAKSILKRYDIPILFFSCPTEKDIIKKTKKIALYGYVPKKSELTVFDTSIKMAFKLFDANKKIQEQIKKLEQSNSELKEKESRFRTLFEVVSVGIVQVDPSDGKLLYFNDKYCKITGFSLEELLSKHFSELTHPDDRSQDWEIFSKAAHDKTATYINEKRYIRKDGSIIWVRINAAFIRNSTGQPVYTIAVCEDITERKLIEYTLKKSETFLNSLIDQSPYSMWISDENGTMIRLNQACCSLFNTSKEEAINIYNLFTDNLIREQGHLEKIETVFNAGKIVRFDINYDTSILKNIKLKPKHLILDVTIFPIKNEYGKVTNAVIQHIDITERRKSEEKIKELLQEKEIILKEVHHRIKNNINVIKSLLMLQLNSITIPEVIEAFQGAINRLQSMEVMYEKLNISETYREISVKDYLIQLIDEIYYVLKNDKLITIEKEIDDFTLNTKKLFPIGILINEMMTNAMKYAFTNRDSGLIMISVVKKNTHIIFIFKDNGIGLPETNNNGNENKKGLGLHLIDILTKQINGILTIERDSGTKFIIEFDI